MSTSYTKAQITRQFLIDNDGKLAWIRWDYLCMREIDPEGLELLNHVAKVKEDAERDGVRFSDTPGTHKD